MSDKPKHFDVLSPDAAAKREQARQRLDTIDPHKQPGGGARDPRRKAWFEAVYALADGDAAGVPWGSLTPNPQLADWLARNPQLDGLKALDVGCGLGDNAAALAGQGADVTAFDLVPRAVEWAHSRFADSPLASHLRFVAADLFAPPDDWRGAFDFIHETYTLQALPAALLAPARKALADMLRPCGRLLVITRAREPEQVVDGPPWPLTRADIMAFADEGLEIVTLDDIPANETRSRHWRALLRRAG